MMIWFTKITSLSNSLAFSEMENAIDCYKFKIINGLL